MNTLDEEKWMYEKFWALLRDKQLMHVFEHYGPQAFRRSSVLEGFEAFIQKHGFRGRVCLEIGTLKWLTAIVLSRYFQRVVTIDIIDDPQKYVIASDLGVTNIEFVHVRDNRDKAHVIDALSFDGAYVDGDHTHDTESDFALVKRCRQVLFHEHWPAQPAVLNTVAALQGVSTEGKFAIWTA